MSRESVWIHIYFYEEWSALVIPFQIFEWILVLEEGLGNKGTFQNYLKKRLGKHLWG